MNMLPTNGKKGTQVIIDVGSVSLDPEAQSPVTLVIPSNFDGKRTTSELETQLKELEVSDIQDLCRKGGYRIVGQYVGEDGTLRDALIPVIDETTFTPDGITLGDPELLRTYVTMRVCDNVANYCGRNGRDQLSDVEVARLRSIVEVLEQAVEGEPE